MQPKKFSVPCSGLYGPEMGFDLVPFLGSAMLTKPLVTVIVASHMLVSTVPSTKVIRLFGDLG